MDDAYLVVRLALDYPIVQCRRIKWADSRQYVDTLPTLAAAIQGRGMEWHLQLNYPVYAAVKALASAVHVSQSQRKC